MNISLFPFALENLVSRDGFGSPVSRQPAHSPYSILRLNLVLIRGIPDFRGAIGSVPSLIYRVRQLLTDGVRCRESARTGPVVLKAVPVAGTVFISPRTN